MVYGFGGFGSLMFSVVPLIVAVGFVVMFGIIIVQSIRGVAQWNRNNESPVLTVEAQVVSKRSDISHHTRHHHHQNSAPSHHTTSSTSYYVTFEVQSGDRLEFLVPDREFGMLVEGDTGSLTFQGTRYKEFSRRR